MKKILHRGVYVLLPLFILSALAFLKWESITYFTLSRVARFYASRSHISLEIGRISGNPFSRTTFENISIVPDKGEPQTYRFTAQSITCNYNLWDLREDFEVFSQGLQCTVQSPIFSYDFISDTPQDLSEGYQLNFSIPSILPKLNVIGGTVALQDSGWHMQLQNINAGLISTEARDRVLQLQVGNFRFTQNEITKIETGFKTSLRYDGSKLTFDSFEADAAGIAADGFVDLAGIDRGYAPFEVELVLDGNRLNFTGSVDKKLFEAQVRADSFDTGELWKRLGGRGWDISGTIKGEAEISYHMDASQDFNGIFKLEFLTGKVLSVDVDKISASGIINRELLNLSAAEAETKGNHIRCTNVSVPVSLLQDGNLLAIIRGSRAEFTAEITDPQKFLRFSNNVKEMIPSVMEPQQLAINGYLDNKLLHLDNGRILTAGATLTIDRAVIPVPANAEALEDMPLEFVMHLDINDLRNFSGLMGEVQLGGQGSTDIIISGSLKELKAAISLSGEYLNYHEKQLGSLLLKGDLQVRQESLGNVDTVEFMIPELAQTNETGVLSLLKPVQGAWLHGVFSAEATFKLDEHGKAALQIHKKTGQDFSAEFTANSIGSVGWLSHYIDKQFFFQEADLEAGLSGLMHEPQLKLSGTVGKAGATGIPYPLAGSFALEYSSKGIAVSEFSWKSPGLNQLNFSGFLPYDPLASKPFLDENLSITAHADFMSLEDVAFLPEPWGLNRGSLVTDLELTGTWDRPVGHILLKIEDLQPPEILKQYMDSPINFQCDLAAQEDIIVLKSADFQSGPYIVQASGSWQHSFTMRDLLRGELTDLKALQGEINADAILHSNDLNFLKRYLPWLRRLEGDMQGGLHLEGPISDPAFSGSFTLEKGEIIHTFNFPALFGVYLQADFDQQSIMIKKMEAEVGGSPVNLEGKITKNEKTVDIDLRVDGKNVLLFRSNDMLMRGDVQLAATGPMEQLRISGTTGLTGGYYSKNFDFLSLFGSSSGRVSEGVNFLFSFSEPPLNDAVFDIKITTLEPFRLRNNLIRGTLRPELMLKGKGELPYLIGTVYIDPSRVLLPSGRLQVQSGLLRFLEGEPDKPRLDLLANSKVLGYDINVLIQGPLNDPVITLSSSPALPNDELLLLLLTGQPLKQELAGGTKGSGTTNVMVYLGRDFLNKWLADESGAGSETLLDRFELDYGRDVTKSGEQTIETTFRLSEQATGTGKIFYLTGEKDKYDAINYGLKLVFRFE